MTPRPRPPSSSRRAAVLALVLPAAACGGGGSSGAPLPPPSGPPELLLARSSVDSRHSRSELRKTDARGITTDFVLDRDGVERDCRIAPDGNRFTFSRETRRDEPQSREIYIGTLDGSVREQRLTVDDHRDDRPCWAPDGDSVVFVSDRLGSGPRLFRAQADGSALEPLFDDGTAQRDPDWSAADGRIVYSVAASANASRAALWLLDPDLRRTTPLTDGGAGSGSPAGSTPAGETLPGETLPGDHQPAWSPDGSTILFSRVLDADSAILCAVDVATGNVTELTEPGAVARRPRWSPQADRIYFVADRPAVGIHGLRLWSAQPGGDGAALVFADARFDWPGLDCLAAMPPVDQRGVESEAADLTAGEVSNGIGSVSRGSLENVLSEDGIVYGLATTPFDGRERAGLEFRIPLDIAAPADLHRAEVELVAQLTEVEDGDVIRVAIRNVSAGRNDTVAELAADGGVQRIAFPVSGLAYVDRDARFGVTVVADKAHTAPGELLIDLVGLRVFRAIEPPAPTGDERR